MRRTGIVLTGILAGCAGSMGMDRGPVSPTAAQVVFDDARIEQALAKRPQLPERVRIAVLFRAPPDGGEDPSWRWDFEERERVVAAGRDLPRVDLFPLAGAAGADLGAIRLAAAEHGADAVLIVGGSAEYETDGTPWVVTYPLVLPLLFAPAQELETRFHIAAAMYDVRNGFLYLTAEAEAVDEQRRAHLWTDREDGVDAAKPRSVERLSAELSRRLAHLTGAPAPGRRARR